MVNVLITGGLGYIGSHICVDLLRHNYNCILVDNLSNSKIEVLDYIYRITNIKPNFYKVDLCNMNSLNAIFIDNKIDSVIHCAGLKSVGESVNRPELYYNNNIVSTINLLECMKNYKVDKLIFSSSATVYGANNKSPLREDMICGVELSNPYAITKYVIEKMLDFFSGKAISLRYFNPIGSHKSGLLTENPNNIPNNLMPYIIKVAKGELPILNIFGNDYPTKDGTCERDYIHVLDLARAHRYALKNVDKMTSRHTIINIGCGKSTSVLQIVKLFTDVNNIIIPYKIAKRREGDLDIVYCDNSLSYKLLGWRAKYTLLDMVKDSY
jgi:UDP-glucose 4-epimerase